MLFFQLMHIVQNRDFLVLIMCNEFNAINLSKIKIRVFLFFFCKNYAYLIQKLEPV
jgi:hypothetical protein